MDQRLSSVLLGRTLSDLSDQFETEIQRIRSSIVQRPSQQTRSGNGFVYIDPHQTVFSDTGSGSDSLGSAQDVDFAVYGVPAGAGRAWVTARLQSNRSGGSAGDSQLYVEWLPTGGTDWLRIAGVYEYMELVDDHTDDVTMTAFLPLKGSTSGQFRVYEAADTWTYTVKLFGYD